MTLSNNEVVRQFVNGAKHGRANNMRIAEGPIEYGGTQYVQDNETALIGYDWAIYAKRGSNGRVIVFNGWREWAKDKPGHSGQTTLQHLSLIEREAKPKMLYDHNQAQSETPPQSAKTMRPQR